MPEANKVISVPMKYLEPLQTEADKVILGYLEQLYAIGFEENYCEPNAERNEFHFNVFRQKYSLAIIEDNIVVLDVTDPEDGKQIQLGLVPMADPNSFQSILKLIINDIFDGNYDGDIDYHKNVAKNFCNIISMYESFNKERLKHALDDA